MRYILSFFFVSQDEYIKAYYEAWRKQKEEDAKRRMQHEGETFTSHSQSERQAGMKYKRENEDEGTEEEADLAAGAFSHFFFLS
jgi:transcription initiation factor TFIIE subunit alpha